MIEKSLLEEWQRANDLNPKNRVRLGKYREMLNAIAKCAFYGEAGMVTAEITEQELETALDVWGTVALGSPDPNMTLPPTKAGLI